MTGRILLYVIAVFITVSSASIRAEAERNSIIINKDVDACSDKNGGIDSECLGVVDKRTENELNTVYQNKLKEITDYDYNQWWMGKKEQRDEMKNAFTKSQQTWIKYRQEYCKAASAGAESIDGYSSIFLSCQINMGIRRIDEINMIHTDLSDG